MITHGAGLYILLAMAFVAANLPLLFERILFVFAPREGRKAFGWRVLELTLLYLAVGVLARALEVQGHGSVYPQAWQFYAVTACLFVVFAFPGFVYRYLWRSRGTGRAPL
jgi:hypothetical protein